MARRQDEEEGYHELSHDGYYDLPPYPHSRRQSFCPFSWAIVLVTVVMVFLLGLIITTGVVFYPTPPDVEVKEWKLNGISVSKNETDQSLLPAYQLNVSLDMVVEIVNRNYAGLVYDDVNVRVVYRGDEIGQVQAEGRSKVKARSRADHTATVELEGNEILENAKQLVVDYYNGKLPLTMYATFDGSLKLWFFQPLLKVTVACDLVLNPKNNTVVSQECGF